MKDKMNFRGCYQTTFGTAAVEAALIGSGLYRSLNGACSTFLTSMIENLYATTVADVKGVPFGAIRSDNFILRGGDVASGSAEHGYFATMMDYSAEVEDVHVPAFLGGSFNGPCQTSGYGNSPQGRTYYEFADIHPTNILGQALSRVEAYPYWVYVRPDVIVSLDPNGGTVSPASLTRQAGSSYGTLPVPICAGAVFEGWYDGETPITGTSVVSERRGNHTLVARWRFLPDLSVAGRISPTTITKSGTFSVTYTVKNAGMVASVASSVQIRFGNAGWSRTVPALSAGATYSETVTGAGHLLGTGSFTVKLTADVGNVVLESDENNNETVVGTLTVVRDPVDSNYDFQYKKRKSSDPDTAWLSTSLSGTKATTSFKLGEPIYIQLGFWNAKRAAATKTIYVQADLAKAGGSRMNYYGWYWPSLGKDVVGYITDEYRKPPMLQNLKEGSYVLTLTLDYTDAYSETDELNNIKTISFSVYDPTPKPTTYTIVFKTDGGSGTMSSLSCVPNKVYALTRCAFKRSGKRFAGWACSNGRRYDDGMLVFDLAKPGETVTMTAIWE